MHIKYIYESRIVNANFKVCTKSFVFWVISLNQPNRRFWPCQTIDRPFATEMELLNLANDGYKASGFVKSFFIHFWIQLTYFLVYERTLYHIPQHLHHSQTLPHGVISKGASLVIGIRPGRFPAPAYRFPCKKGLPLSVTT